MNWKLLAVAGLGAGILALARTEKIMARIDDVEKAVERMKADAASAVETMRSQATEIADIKQKLAAEEEVDPARLDALVDSINGVADGLEAGTKGSPGAAPIPPPIQPPQPSNGGTT